MFLNPRTVRERCGRSSALPALGRFVEPDPLGYEDDANLYAYVGNDPVNLVDPLGLDDQVICTGSHLTVGCGGGGLFGGFSGFSTAGVTGRVELGGRGRSSPPSSPPPGSSGAGHYTWQSGWVSGSDDPNISITAGHWVWVSDSIVLAPTGEAPFYFNGERFILDPTYRKPRWSDKLDVAFGCLAVCPLAAGAIYVTAPAVTETLGPAGPIFGDTAFGAARQGWVNVGRARIGFGRGGGVANFRIGIDSNKLDIFNLPIPPRW